MQIQPTEICVRATATALTKTQQRNSTVSEHPTEIAQSRTDTETEQ